MRWYHYVAYFFGGAFLANAVPHFVNGVSGRPFQSPFASPPGEGLSSSTVSAFDTVATGLGTPAPFLGVVALAPCFVTLFFAAS